MDIGPFVELGSGLMATSETRAVETNGVWDIVVRGARQSKDKLLQARAPPENMGQTKCFRRAPVPVANARQ